MYLMYWISPASTNVLTSDKLLVVDPGGCQTICGNWERGIVGKKRFLSLLCTPTWSDSILLLQVMRPILEYIRCSIWVNSLQSRLNNSSPATSDVPISSLLYQMSTNTSVWAYVAISEKVLKTSDRESFCEEISKCPMSFVDHAKIVPNIRVLGLRAEVTW